ncbi:Zinc finger protein HD1, partial [Ananas comosus]
MEAAAAAAAGAESGPVALPFDSHRLAYLCAACYAQLHVSRCVCEACERAIAAVDCRADDAALCADCDVQVHSANTLDCRQHRFPAFPLSAAAAEAFCDEELELEAAAAGSWPLLDENYYNDDAGDAGLPPYGEVDEYLDLAEHDYDLFYNQTQEDRRWPVSCDENEARECEVPSQPQLRREASNCKAGSGYTASYSSSSTLTGMNTSLARYLLPFYNSRLVNLLFQAENCFSKVSFSSMEAIAVPDTTLSDTTNSYLLHCKGTIDLFSGPSLQLPLHFKSVDRKARVLRYREKRKTRKFEKTIRYASRKAYAESRPRIKGRFVKRSDLALKVDKIDVFSYCDIP